MSELATTIRSQKVCNTLLSRTMPLVLLAVAVITGCARPVGKGEVPLHPGSADDAQALFEVAVKRFRGNDKYLTVLGAFEKHQINWVYTNGGGLNTPIYATGRVIGEKGSSIVWIKASPAEQPSQWYVKDMGGKFTTDNNKYVFDLITDLEYDAYAKKVLGEKYTVDWRSNRVHEYDVKRAMQIGYTIDGERKRGGILMSVPGTASADLSNSDQP